MSLGDMPCKIYTNQTLLGGLCPVPEYAIAPLVDYLNESKTDPISQEIQKYYNQVSDQVLNALNSIPAFLRSSSCANQLNNLACGMLLCHFCPITLLFSVFNTKNNHKSIIIDNFTLILTEKQQVLFLEDVILLKYQI